MTTSGKLTFRGLDSGAYMQCIPSLHSKGHRPLFGTGRKGTHLTQEE